MKHTEPRLFAQEEIERKLSELGDPLEKLSKIDWEIFREIIENALVKKGSVKRRSPALR